MEYFSKINPPRSSGIFPRERLFRELDKLREHPILWIAGSAGSGKTSLISSYSKKRTTHILWYQLDSGDGDIATFFYFLSKVIERVSSRRKKPLLLCAVPWRFPWIAFYSILIWGGGRFRVEVLTERSHLEGL
jgi:LuxR family transcriptional regulator, maltose regulon positive regulatory protein